jgi:hypothetical protein
MAGKPLFHLNTVPNANTGRKRAADTDSPPATRSAKVPKTSGATTKGKKGGPKAHLSATAFKARAPALHVNVTHTPPAVTEGDSTTADPGFIGALTLLPASLSTGSYGWKGSKRITVEIENPEGGDKDKIQVQLTYVALFQFYSLSAC